MVSNYDRVYEEIQKEALKIANSENIDSDALVRLAMEIVDEEDRNRISATYAINQKIAGMIRNAATEHMGDASQDSDENNAEVP